MIILVGASASGKTVICKELIESFGMQKFVTTTTRKIRINEKNNFDYYFISKDEFEQKIKNNEFIEHVEYNGNLYGSEKKEIADNKVIILEPSGLFHFLKMHNDSIVSFYIECNEEIRKERMIDRQDNKDDIEKRIINDREVFKDKLKDNVDFIINSENSTVKELAKKIYKLYKEKISKN
jgi:guanylate kinase